MLQLLLLAGLAMRPIEIKEPVLDVRVVDVDADGREDVVVVTESSLYLFRGGEGEPIRRDAPPLTLLGRGLVGVVREGRHHPVAEPFAETWTEGPAGATSLLASLGKGKPALLVSPGDLTGDGRYDPVLASREGFQTPSGLVPMRPEAELQIKRNETFAVEYRIPVPVVGDWTGGGKELVFVDGTRIVSYRGVEKTADVDLAPLLGSATDVKRVSRHQVLVRDVNGNGRLDVVLVQAQGSTEVFAEFQAMAWVFLDGRLYDAKRKGFYRPSSLPKVEGALLKPDLLDLDSDGDLDLVLSTINTSILHAARGTAPGTYYAFRFDGGRYRKPTWIHRGDVPLSAFTEKPRPPATFLPDLDDDGFPEVLTLDAGVELLEADEKGEFHLVARQLFEHKSHPVRGRKMAVVPGDTGILIVEATR